MRKIDKDMMAYILGGNYLDEFSAMQKLGLDPDFIADNRRRMRGKGLTTGMLISALVALSQGKKVRIAAYRCAYAEQLIHQLKEMAAKLNIPVDKLSKQGYDFSDRSHQQHRGYDGMIFDDHYID